MGRETVESFIKAINESTELQNQARSALEGAQDPSGFVQLGKKSGYEFTETDAKAYFDEVLGAQQPAELSEEELENVAGGAGAKDMPSPASRLGETIRMFKGLKLNAAPRWTSFR
jgi:predicted ribosomally synthesized peptide with nif11-like leader